MNNLMKKTDNKEKKTSCAYEDKHSVNKHSLS